MNKATKELVEKYINAPYEIHEDRSVSVDGSVYLGGLGLTEIPFQFREVKGDFYCGYNQLTSLAGAPQSVGGDFDCGDNQLTSLAGAPQSIGKSFYCGYNQLTSLAGAPQSVGGDFDCGDNQLTSLAGAPQSIGKSFYCGYNQLTSLAGAPPSIGRGFYCSYNKLTSLAGAPQSVGGHFDCSHNNLNFTVQNYIDWFKLEPFEDGFVVYKRVSCDFKTQEGTDNETIWLPGTTVEVPFWNIERECGEGKFHACFDKDHCDNFRSEYRDKYIKIKVRAEDMHAFPNPEYLEKIAFQRGFVIEEIA